MTIGSLLYFGALALWSAFVAHLILQCFFPLKGKQEHLPQVVENTTPQPIQVSTIPATFGIPKQTTSSFNPDEGFKSFQQGPDLTTDDIVKGLSRG